MPDSSEQFRDFSLSESRLAIFKTPGALTFFFFFFQVRRDHLAIDLTSLGDHLLVLVKVYNLYSNSLLIQWI